MTTGKHVVELSGLDGANPLSFLAALGLLSLVGDLDDEASVQWVERGRWLPLLCSRFPRDELPVLLRAGLDVWRDEPVMGLEYPKGGKGASARDLKPPPGLYRRFLETLVDRSHQVVMDRSRDLSSEVLHRARRSLDHAAAFATDTGVDNNGNTKPSALHFTAGQQEFLAMACQLVDETTPAQIEEALFGPWRYASSLPVLGWDSSSTRDYALRADDPAANKKTGVPGADVLALIGLGFVPLAPTGRRVDTTGWTGTWKNGAWTWCLWTVPLRRPAIRSLLRIPGLARASSEIRLARGIGAVLRCRVRRSDQGGYGTFLPADILPPGAA